MHTKRKREEDMEIVWQTPANPPERHDYIFRNGIRYVKPYYFDFISHVQRLLLSLSLTNLVLSFYQVIPSIQGKKGDILFHELVKRWNNHKIITRWLVRFFHYLDRYLVPRRSLLSLQETSHLTFYELVYGEMNDQVRDAVISLIGREREGEHIDQALVKNVLDIYVEMDGDSMKYYVKDFEKSMLKDTAVFYSKKASDWMSSKSNEDYMLKVEECLKQEEGRVQCYLRDRSKHKLLEVVEYELLTVHASKLEEKKKQINPAAV